MSGPHTKNAIFGFTRRLESVLFIKLSTNQTVSSFTSSAIPRGITFGVPSFDAVATGNTFIFPNASFISGVNFTMVPSPMFIRDSFCIYFSVATPLPVPDPFFYSLPATAHLSPDRFSYLLKRVINVCVTRTTGKKDPLLVHNLQCPADCKELCMWS